MTVMNNRYLTLSRTARKKHEKHPEERPPLLAYCGMLRSLTSPGAMAHTFDHNEEFEEEEICSFIL